MAEVGFLAAIYWIVVALVVIILAAVASHVAYRLYEAAFVNKSSSFTERLLQDDANPDHRDYVLSGRALAVGKELAHASQHMDWSRASLHPNKSPERYGVLADVHRRFIVGVGLPLYYNFYLLPLTSGVVAVAIMQWVGSKSRLHEMLNKSDAAEFDFGIVEHAQRVWYGITALLIFMIVYAWCHTFVQKLVIKRFDKENSTMADYTLHLSGLLPEMTSELKLMEHCQAHFQTEVVGISIAYDLCSDPSLQGEVYDMAERSVIYADVALHDAMPCNLKAGTYLDVLGSVRKVAGLGLPSKVGYPKELAGDSDFPTVPDSVAWRKIQDSSRLKCSGDAWVVFPFKSTCDKVRGTIKGFWIDAEITICTQAEADAMIKALVPHTAMRANPLGFEALSEIWPSMIAQVVHATSIDGMNLPLGTRVHLVKGQTDFRVGQKVAIECRISVQECTQEPLAACWYNQGKNDGDMMKALWYTFFLVTVTFLLIAGLVYFPYAKYILLPFAMVGARPGPATGQIMGFLLGIANQILGAVMGIHLWGAGLKSKNSLDMTMLVFATLTGYWNTIFSLSVGLYPMREGFGATDVSESMSHSVVLSANHTLAAKQASLLKELELSDLLYTTLVPGWLFSGFIIGNIVGYIVPFIQNGLLMRIVYSCRCAPYWLNKILTLIIPYQPEPGRLTARKAEFIFQPSGLGLAWDYTSLIITPSICFMMFFLFTETKQLQMLFLIMVGWVSFMYLYHRFVHLRFQKKDIHANAALDDVARYVWGLPIAVVAGAMACCNARLGNATHWGILGNSLLALVVYWGGLIAVGPLTDINTIEEDQSYNAAQQGLLYSWFNCNPVHVLKSRYGDFLPRAPKPDEPMRLGRWWYKPSKVWGATHSVPLAKQLFSYGKEYHVLDQVSRDTTQKRFTRGSTSYVVLLLHLVILIGALVIAQTS